MRGRLFALTLFFVLGGAGDAMATLDTNAPALAAGNTAEPPASRADVGPWGAAIVRRAAQLIPTPAQWDKKSTGDCPANATTFSLICALRKVVDDAGANQKWGKAVQWVFSHHARWAEGRTLYLFDIVPWRRVSAKTSACRSC